MKIEKVIVGPIETNCYILNKNNHILIIDPGDEFNKISSKINNYIVDGIIITHYHFDHIGALEELKNKYQTKVYDYSNLNEGVNKIGDFTFNVLYTPGHKEDLITIIFNEEKVMFVGDFIFKNSIGRTDLPGGNMNEMIKSINKIKEYSDNFIIYPGHGPSTTLKAEKRYNPFFSK